MELTAETVSLVAVAALAVAALAVAVAGVALAGQRRVRRAYGVFSGGSRDDVLTLLQRHIDEVAALRGDVAGLAAYAEDLRGLLRSAVSRVGVIRYDAFSDMGGRLSFSAALLDEHGDGVVVTSINGRSETRTYAKPVVAGQSPHNLSEEEEAAVRDAMSMSGRTAGSRRARARVR